MVRRKTYANIAATAVSSNAAKQVWKSPEKKVERYECSIRKDDVTESERVLNEVKSNLKGSNVDGLKGIWRVKGGRVIIEGHSRERIKKVTGWLSQDNKLKI